MLLLALLLLLLLVLILLVLLPLEERLVSGNMACTFSTLRCRPPHEFLCGDLRAVFGVWGSAQCTFVSVSVCLPVRVAAAPVNPFRSLPIDFVDSSSVDLPFFAGILEIFLLFLLLCCFVFVFRVTSLFIHYVYWLILDTFGTLYSISAMHFMHSTSHIRRLIFHFQFFIFFFLIFLQLCAFSQTIFTCEL